MNSWIDSAQLFFVSNCTDEQARSVLMTQCPIPNISSFIPSLPLQTYLDLDLDHAKAFVCAIKNPVERFVIKLLVHADEIFSVQSPLSLSVNDRAVRFEFVLALSTQSLEYPELQSASACLWFLLATGRLETKDYIAAKEAYEQALRIYRTLAQSEYNTHLPELALTLANFAALLRSTNDLEASLSKYKQALEIYRMLALAEPDLNIPGLAVILNNYGNLLENRGEFGAAQYAYEEALLIRRQLAEKDSETYSLKVATTLSNLSNLLISMRDFSAARTACEEALHIHRNLSEDKKAVNLSDLAMTLNQLGNILSSTKDFQASQAAHEEALSIKRHLTEIDSSTYLIDVALTLNNLGNLLTETRDFGAAHAAFKEAIQIRRKYAKSNPSAYLPGVATTLNNHGALLSDLEELDAAQTCFNEALLIRRELAQLNKSAFLPDVATTLNNLGVLLTDMHKYHDAQSASEEALNIRRKLTKEDPSIYLPAVATTLNNLGNLFRVTYKYDSAQAAYQEALTIYRELAETYPTTYLQGVIMILNNLGSIQEASNNLDLARRLYKEAISTAETARIDSDRLNLQKSAIPGAYQFLLADVVAGGHINSVKAFNLCVAMRDGQSAGWNLGPATLQRTQNWLANYSEKTGVKHQILITNCGPSETLILGLVDEKQCYFEHVIELNREWRTLTTLYTDIVNSNKNTIWQNINLKRQHCARKIWNSLSQHLQSALNSDTDTTTLISGDAYCSNFPWELLKFGDGEQDYLGLKYPLPRIGALQDEGLDSQLNFDHLGIRPGRVTILAPFDTGLMPLLGVLDEIETIEYQLSQLDGNIINCAKGKKASKAAIEHQIACEPDIFYYSGHGEIVRNEELLVLHQNVNSKETISQRYYFGKEQLAILANQSEGTCFPNRPLIVLNSCFSGRSRISGGAREDFVSSLLSAGAGAVIATAFPLHDGVGCAFGEALFNIDQHSDLATIVVSARKRLSQQFCADLNSEIWGAWSMLHIHGNANVNFPLTPAGSNRVERIPIPR